MGSIASHQAAAGRRYRVRWRDDSTHDDLVDVASRLNQGALAADVSRIV